MKMLSFKKITKVKHFKAKQNTIVYIVAREKDALKQNIVRHTTTSHKLCKPRQLILY
jgi:hypothetical protein